MSRGINVYDQVMGIIITVACLCVLSMVFAIGKMMSDSTDFNKLVKNCDKQTSTTYLTVVSYRKAARNDYEYEVEDTDGHVTLVHKENLVSEGNIYVDDVIQADVIKYIDRDSGELVLRQYKGVKADIWTPGPTEEVGLPSESNSSESTSGSPTLR